jgi:hypothetical protein
MSTLFPSQPLFHYCSLAEFQAILDSQSLWLTPDDQQNELDMALGTIKAVIATGYPGLSTEGFNLDSASSLPVYAYLLSSQKDLGGLWQPYYPAGGFTISINTAQLSVMMDTCNLILYQCLYDEAEKTNFIIQNIVETSPGEYADSIGLSEPSSVLDPRSEMFVEKIKLINRNILNYAGVLKDTSRKGEQEWRIMIKYVWSNILAGPSDEPPDPLLLDVQSMQVNNVSVNYLSAPLVNAKFTAAGIEEVVIGPNPDMAQAKSDCETLFANLNLINVVITESGLPYLP